MDLKAYFHEPYQGGESFINNVILPIFGEDKYDDAYEEDVIDNNPELERMAESTGISQILRLGTIDIPMNPTDVFDITVNNRVQMERNRVAIQMLIRRIMSTYSSAFMVFHYNDTNKWDWRFSFCSKQGNNSETTDSKRYTFLLGPNQSCRTAAENFNKLAEKTGEIELDDIVKAFDVEVLSKEFFDKYKHHYECFCEYVYDNKDNTECFGREFSECEDKIIRDYVKKLLGRIVFLHFLQKKGWMGVPADKEWGEGDLNFMRNLFSNASQSQKENFLDKVLKPLFEKGLDTDRTANNDLFNTGVEGFKNVKIPYLNGGLFEKDELDKPKARFSAQLFDDLLEFFYEYNFTIDENDPNDAQVGVDPEMLGRIFENLLEDNKDKGAFYTPKEIVQYMCKESLIAYLLTDVKTEETKKAIRTFVTTYDVNAIGGKDSATAKDIDEYLKDVKICDPAIGSGAFPMGMLKELFFCRGAIENFNDAAEIKRHIIQQNIYGVDIEKGAVDIARLRFWLALIVDEKTPHALPNMDFKIMQGNSLLEQYKGVDLSRIMESKTIKSGPIQMTFLENDVDELRRQLISLRRTYFNTVNKQQKQSLRISMRNIVQQQIDFVVNNFSGKYGNKENEKIKLDGIDIASTPEFFLWHTWFCDVFENGGFDIVIGNPPYLESRSPNFSESLKIRLQSEIQNRRMSDSGFFPRGADLLIFFYELSLRLLNKNGYNVFITENSWLSTDYGKLFQNFLLKRCEVHAIIDSEYKYFENADINTIITIIKNRNELECSLPVKFFHCNGSLEKYPCDTFAINDTENISLKSFSSSDPILQNYKWGAIIRAEQNILRIIETISRFEDKKFSSKISIGQGLNLTKKHIVHSKSSQTYPYYTSEIGATYSWNNSTCYVSKDDISGSRKMPVLIMPRGIGTHFCSINECSGYTSSYVEVYGNLTNEETLNIWLFCNSSLFWLLREITGRTNLGGGMLKAEATDLKSLPICFNFNRPSEISDIYIAVKDKPINTNISTTLNDSQHNEIDHIVFKFFGLEKEETYIKTMLLDMVDRRMKKSKTK